MTGETSFLTVPEVAKRLDCCTDRIYTAIRAGELRASKPGRKFLIRPEALDAWVAELEEQLASA